MLVCATSVLKADCKELLEDVPVSPSVLVTVVNLLVVVRPQRDSFSVYEIVSLDVPTASEEVELCKNIDPLTVASAYVLTAI